MRRRLGAIIMLLLCCLALAGCLGSVQADDYMYVVGIGFDRGREYKYNISFLVQKEVGGEGQSSTGGIEVYSAEGDSIFDAITTLHAGGPFRLNFSRTNTIMFSRELAEEGEMEQLMDIAFNALKLRQSAKLLVTLCPVRDFMDGLRLEQSPNVTKLMASVMENYGVDGITAVTNYALMTESVRDKRLDGIVMLGGLDETAADSGGEQPQGGGGQDSADMVQGGGEEAGSGGSQQQGQQKENQQDKQDKQEYTTAGVYRSGGMGAYVSGVALFDGWRMAGALDGHDTKFLLLGKGDFNTGNITIPYDGDRVVAYLRAGGKPRVTMDLSGEPRALVEMEMVCGILQYMGEYGQDEWERGLKAAAEEYIEGELGRVFEACRRMGSDAMGFGRYAVMEFDGSAAWEAYDWQGSYPGLEVEFRVELDLADENIAMRLE